MIIQIFEKNKGSVHVRWESSLRGVLGKSTADLDLEVIQAPQELQKSLLNWELTGDISLINKPEYFNDEKRLFIPGAIGFYKQQCLKEAPHAHHGCCLWGEYIAVEYKLSTQLHECLHLFRVNECYNPQTREPIPECTNDQCVMRYGVISTEVCSHVLEQLNYYHST